MSDVDPGKLQQTLDDVYRPGPLRFCHDPEYRLAYSDRWLCSIEGGPQRCPALKQLCATSLAEPERTSAAHHGPTWVAGLADVLFWLLMAALLVAVGLALASIRIRRRHDAAAAAERPSLEPEETLATTPAGAGDRDVARLLDKARRAAERGELGVAIDAAHAAAIQGLSAAGHVELDRDRTNGDYLRDLRKQPPLREQFRGIVGQVELLQFGGRAPSRSAFDRVLSDVTALLRRIAVLSLLLLSALLGVGCGSGGISPEPEERSPHGLYALRRLLGDQGAKVHQRVSPLSKIEADVGLIVLYSTELEAAAQQRVLGWVIRGGAVVVVGSSELGEAAQVERRSLDCRRGASRGPGSDLPELRLGLIGARGFAPKPLPESEVAHAVDVTCDGNPYIVTAFFGDGHITFIPERELVSNASLSMADNARLVAELMATDGTVELVGPWTGDGSQSPVQSMKAAGLSPVMLQLFALALLIAVRQGTSFGARRDVMRHERRAFSDHVRALASTYARAGAEPLASSHYGALLIDQLRERTCPGQHPTLLQLAAAIARRVGKPEPEIVRLLVDAKSAFDDGGDRVLNRQLITELEQLSLLAGGTS